MLRLLMLTALGCLAYRAARTIIEENREPLLLPAPSAANRPEGQSV